MKIKKIILSILLLIAFPFSLASCFAGVFEEEINVVFMYEDELISSDTVTQFKNIKAPSLTEAYIPDGYKFFGWTPLNPEDVYPTDVNFKDEYIGPEKMLHWSDIEKHKDNKTVVCKALIINKEEIPKEYHYVVIAWYDKVATSGLDEAKIKVFADALKEYLKGEGVSDNDINTIVIRGYSGNVGPSCGSIMEDGDIDIMFGWGNNDNVINTGGMKEEMLHESVTFDITYSGAVKTRYVHRLTDSETVIKVMEWMKSDKCKSLFK